MEKIMAGVFALALGAAILLVILSNREGTRQLETEPLFTIGRIVGHDVTARGGDLINVDYLQNGAVLSKRMRVNENDNFPIGGYLKLKYTHLDVLDVHYFDSVDESLLVFDADSIASYLALHGIDNHAFQKLRQGVK